jgi:MFS family permease
MSPAPADLHALIDSPAAWRRLIVSLAIATVGGIGVWSVVVALPAVQAEFGVARGEASLPYTATMIGFGLGAVIVGKVADRVGVFPLLVMSALSLGIGYALAAQAATLLQFTLIHGVFLGFLGASPIFAPLIADISFWFRRRRGIAVAICASGNYLAGTLWPPIIQWAIGVYGWRPTHIVVGLICVATMIPLAFLLRARMPLDAPPVPGVATPVSGASTLGLSPATLMLLLSVAGFACCMAMAMPQVHIVAYCADLGYGPARGAEMLSLMLGLGIVSRIASGFIADRIGGLWTLIAGSGLQMLALMLYLFFDSLVSLYLISALFGLVQGGIVPSYAIIIRELLPPREAASRIGLVVMMTIAGMAAGGFMSGRIFDVTGSYQVAFLNGVLWNALNLVIAFYLVSRSRLMRPALV